MSKDIELVQYDTTNVQRREFGGRRAAALSVGKAGAFRLNKSACEALGLKGGDHVALLQDSNNPGNWYLRTDDEEGFELRENKAGGLVFQSSSLRDTVLESLGAEESVSLQLGEKEVISEIPVWPLVNGIAATAGEEEPEEVEQEG